MQGVVGSSPITSTNCRHAGTYRSQGWVWSLDAHYGREMTKLGGRGETDEPTASTLAACFNRSDEPRDFPQRPRGALFVTVLGAEIGSHQVARRAGDGRIGA